MSGDQKEPRVRSWKTVVVAGIAVAGVVALAWQGVNVGDLLGGLFGATD